MVQGRSAQAFQQRLAARDTSWRGGRGRRHGRVHLHRARRTLPTGANPLTDQQHRRLQDLVGNEGHPTHGCELMQAVVDTLSAGMPAPLTELRRLGRTLKRRATDVLAHLDRPHPSNGPTQAVNGRLEHLRGSALGFRHLTNDIARSLFKTGGFQPATTPSIVKSPFTGIHQGPRILIRKRLSPR